MNDPKLPAEKKDGGGEPMPEVRLELTQAGVRQVLSLYAEEAAGRSAGGVHIGFDDILRAIVIRKWTVLLCAAAGIVAGLLVLMLATRLYTVTTEVVLDRQNTVESTLNAGSGGSAFIATQAEILHSRSVVADAVTSLESAPADQEDPIAAALEALQASPVSGTQVVALSYLGPEPEYGARLLAATVEAYRERLRLDEIRSQTERLKAKETEYRTLLEEMETLEQRLAEIRRNHFGGASAEDALAAQNQIIRTQSQQLADVRQQRIALENQLLAGSLSSLSDDPVARSLQDRLNQAEAELARLTQTLKPGHPSRTAAERDVAFLREQLASNARNTPRLLRREIEAAKGIEAELLAVLEAEQNRLAEAERMRRDEQLVMDELEQTRGVMEQRRRVLLDQRLLTRLSETGDVGVTARMIAEPVIPRSPTWPNPVLVLVLGASLGLALGVLWAVVGVRREEADLIFGEPGRLRPRAESA